MSGGAHSREGARRRRWAPVWVACIGCALAPLAPAQVPAGAEAESSPARGAEEARAYGLRSGRFVVVAAPGADGLRLARLAEESWEFWRQGLFLPERMSTPVTVRLQPEEGWTVAEPHWRVVVEPGGVITLWLRGGGEPGTARDRRWLTALAASALQRQAVFLGVPADRAAAPDWLALAAAEAALVRMNPALLDAWCQDATRTGRMPPLQALLAWQRAQSSPETDPRRLAAFGAWRWLRANPAGEAGWRKFLGELLSGTSPGSALVRSYGGSFSGADAAEIELAWQVGASAMARTVTVPLMEAEESRLRLEQADRLVAARALDPRAEEVVSLAEQWSTRRDAFVADAREARLAWLESNFARLHPFYRNAGASLGRALVAQRDGDAGAWAAALWDWRRDLAAGRELEAGSRALLDEPPPNGLR